MHVEDKLVAEAIRDFAAVIQSDDAPPGLRAAAAIWRGSKHRDNGELEKAVSDFSFAIDLNGSPIAEKARALGARGWVHYVARRFHDAIKDDRDALALTPGECLIMGNLALALLVAGKPEEALQAYADALVLADLKQLEEIAKDLYHAVDTHGLISGMELAVTRVNAQLAMLRQRNKTATGQSSSRETLEPLPANLTDFIP